MKFSKIDKNQALLILKVAVYLTVSGLISYAIGLVANDPTIWGPLTPFINILLVSLKQALTESEQ